MTETKFSWRAFISFGLTFSFLAITLTGIVLYFAPAGRIAHWINWKFWALDKDQWQAIHITFSLMFIVLSVFHLFSINWKTFLSYIRKKSEIGLNKHKEMIFSLLLTVLFFFGTLLTIPPFSSVLDFSAYLKGTWEQTDTNPPVPHAELLTLVELSEKVDDLPLEKITNRLNANNIRYKSVNQTLNEIGQVNQIAPIKLYKMLTSNSLSGMAGSGIGRKTISEFAAEKGKSVVTLIQILKDNNISATGDQTLKDLASENDMAAKDIYELIK